MRILFLADVHGVTEYLEPLVAAEPDVDLALLGGDLTNFGGDGEALGVIEPLRRAYPEVRAVPGNVDLPEVEALLRREGLSLHGRGELVGDVYLSGCGGSNLTPLLGPTEFSEERLAEILAAGDPGPARPAPWILVSHVPPYDTAVDRMFLGSHVGSTALRSFLDRARPSLCLCGHIHEAAGEDRPSGVRVINSGSFSARRYVLVDVDEATIRCEPRQLGVDAATRLRATGRNVAEKVRGFARHRFGW